MTPNKTYKHQPSLVLTLLEKFDSSHTSISMAKKPTISHGFIIFYHISQANLQSLTHVKWSIYHHCHNDN